MSSKVGVSPSLTHSLTHSFTQLTAPSNQSEAIWHTLFQRKTRFAYIVLYNVFFSCDALLRLCLHMTFRPDEAVKTKCNGRDLWSVISEGLNFLL
jgi:hypothetical protein